MNQDPKKDVGAIKPPLALIPPAANVECAKALNYGANLKPLASGKLGYGERNWLQNPVEYMTYLHAMKRHIDCILDGEDIDPESGAHHAGHVMAGCCIILDAKKHGSLFDNRVLPTVKQP